MSLVLTVVGTAPCMAAPDSLQDKVHAAFKAGRAGDAAALLQQEAFRGNPEAQYGLGILYEKGLPEAKISQDESQAFHWYSLSAQNGYAPSQNNLGVLYYTGRGTPKSEAEALRWYEKAAQQGNAMAQYNLGAMYFHGHGVTKDLKKALELYKQSAGQGNVTAENNLGYMYEHGLGVQRDFREAVRWYERAAKSGQDYAQRNLAEMYEHGVGARRNYAHALTWYKKAAEQGHAHAQMKLGRLYEQGRGTAKDLVEAYAWYWAARPEWKYPGQGCAGPSDAAIIHGAGDGGERSRIPFRDREAAMRTIREPSPGYGNRLRQPVRAVGLRDSRRGVCQPGLRRPSHPERRRSGLQRRARAAGVRRHDRRRF